MSLQAFDAQLLVPDNHASHLQLVHLITAGQFTGTGLPDVAHRYLDAFCNKSYSNGRRRWAGIALGGMMRASASVIQRLKKLSQGTPRLGAIILDREENEERRIIAGLIIRQGLEAGIDFAAFWESDKVMNSAPNFPRDASEQWMGQFQNYLDSLGELLLTNLNNDPVIMFPISLFARDGFQWTGSSAVAITENDLLTIIALNPTLTTVRFIDIPISHIRNTSLQQDSPHESQEGRSGHKMHTVTMALAAEASTYRLDSADRTASEFKVSFLSHEDADEFEIGLQDAFKSLGRARAATVEAAGSTAYSNSSDSSRKSIAKPDNTTLPPRHKDSTTNGARSGSTGMAEEPLPSDQPGVQQDIAQQVAQEKGKGKLPKISNATKQKVVRTKQLPSSRSKIMKSRSSTKANPSASRSEDKDGDGDEVSLQDEYSLKSGKAAHGSSDVGNGRKLQGRRKANFEEDDDFVPAASKVKSKPAKRKRRSSDATDDGRSKKKTQIKPSDDPQLAAVGTTKRPRAKAQDEAQTTSGRAREPMQQSITQQNVQNETSSRPSLIGSLLKSKSPNKATAPTFKKPGQPASTPGRPRVRHIQASPRPQTPIETRADFDNLPVYISSSTPRSQAIHDEDFGLHYTPANTEILSSNTKRVPDSPHAESRAISGHADCDHVHREKWQGDMETAKSDPFKQRRQGSKMTSFIRRLTEERIAEDRPGSAHGESFSITFEMNDDTEIDELTSNSACKPFPKHSPSLFKYHPNTHHQSRAQQSSARIAELERLPTTPKESRKAIVTTSHEAAHSVKRGASHGTIESPKSTIHTREDPISLKRPKDAHVAAAKNDRIVENTVKQQAKANFFGASVSRDANEKSLTEILAHNKDQDDLDGDTTLIGEADLPVQNGAQASELYFRSSPPIPDSSSVRGASSDESEAEPELSPPTSRADELEWEAALQPHQRAIHEQLLRTSKRVMRHIVDNETAVTDVTDVFAEDGERLLGLMLERQNEEFAKVFQELAGKKQELLKEFSDASKSLKAQRKHVKSMS